MQKAFSGGVVLVNARMAHHHPMLGIFNITIEGVDGGPAAGYHGLHLSAVPFFL